MSARTNPSTTRTVRQDRLPYPLGAIWSAAVTSKQAGEVHRATENVLRFIAALLLTDVLDLEWPAPVAELLAGGPEKRGLEKLGMGSRVGLVRELVKLHAGAPEDGPPRVLPPLSDWWDEVAPLLTASVEARNRDAHGMVAQQETDAALDRLATVLRRSRWLGEVQLVLATATGKVMRLTRGEVQRLVGVSPFDDLRCRFEATWRVPFSDGFVHLGSGDGSRWALCPFLLPEARGLGILDGISRRGALRFGNPLAAADTPVPDGRGLPGAEGDLVDWQTFLAQRAEVAPEYRLLEERPHASLCLPVPPAKQLAEGMVLDGDYRLVRPLGEGGMAVVWEVEGVHTGGRHALKIPRAEVADTEFEVRFRREIDLLRRLHAEGVRRVLGPVERIALEVGEERLTVLRMPVLRETLADRLRAAGGALPEAQVLAWGEQVLEALVDLHARGVVHRDIKPSNLLLDADDAIVLADFGIARDGGAEARLTRTVARMGSELYMAPEQFRAARTVTGKADVFALAVTLHELATGTPSPTPGAGLSGSLGEWLPRMAALDRNGRPEAVEVLQAWIDAREVERPGVTPTPVLIPAGEFWMGSPDDDDEGWDHEMPRHRVRITRPFWMMSTPVTQGEYASLMGHNPSRFTGRDYRPVEQVSWFDAVRYCNARSSADGLPEAYVITETEKPDRPHVRWHGASHPGWRLPTEAEWEYAARAGCEAPRHGPVDEVAWHDGNSRGRTHPVGLKAPNVWGLYDTLGNVCEWVWDAWGDYFDPEVLLLPGAFGWDPEGEATLGFGPHRGRRLRDVASEQAAYLAFVRDEERFDADVRSVVKRALEGEFPSRTGPWTDPWTQAPRVVLLEAYAATTSPAACDEALGQVAAAQEVGSDRVLRGGSWVVPPQGARVAIRYFYGPGYRNEGLGFRLSRTVP